MKTIKKIIFSILIIIFAISIFLVVSYFLNRNSGKGALQVTSVQKSKVYLNGKLLGETPLCKCEYPNMLDVGDYTVKVVPEQTGLDPFEEKITISPSVLTVVDRTFGKGALSEGSVISLVPITDKKDAQILVISFPDRTQVYLDGNLEGITPLLLKNQTESDHEIKLTRDGYKDKTIRIRTVKGFRLESTVFLSIAENSSASALPSSVPTPTIISVTKIIISSTPTGFLRVRASNSLSAAEIGQVNPGETYNLLNESEGWYQIKLVNGKIGWVSNQYATKQ